MSLWRLVLRQRRQQAAFEAQRQRLSAPVKAMAAQMERSLEPTRRMLAAVERDYLPTLEKVERYLQPLREQAERYLQPLREQAERYLQPLREQAERLTYASLGMTQEEYQALSPEDRQLLFGAPELPAPAELPPPPPPPEPAAWRKPADPEPGADASTREHDAWMLRRLARRHPDMPAEVEGHQERKAEWLAELVADACRHRPGSSAKVHRNRLRPKLQSRIDSQRKH
jgi:hypothetical protein